MISGMTSEEYSILSQNVIEPLKSWGCRVWIFGSRARGTQQKFSDVDLLYSSPKTPFPSGYLSKIAEDIEESRLPYKVDLVHEDQIASSYRDGIIKDRIEL